MINSITGKDSAADVNRVSQANYDLVGNKDFDSSISPDVSGTTTLIGKIYVNGDANFSGKLVMNASTDLLCVDGDLQIDGSLTGKGTIIVGGNLDIGGVSSFEGDIYVGGNLITSESFSAKGKIICKGNITIGNLFNFYGINSNVPGVLYCDGNFKQATLLRVMQTLFQGTITFVGNVELTVYVLRKGWILPMALFLTKYLLSKEYSITAGVINEGVIYTANNFKCTNLNGSAMFLQKTTWL